MKKCKYCNEEIDDEAIVCKHCGNDLIPRKSPRLRKKRGPGRIALIVSVVMVLFFVSISIFHDQITSATLKEFLSDIFHKTDKGELYAVSVSFGLNDALDGRIDKSKYEGTITLKKTNGEEIEALCEPALFKSLRGGQTIKVQFDKELDAWVAIKIIKDYDEK